MKLYHWQKNISQTAGVLLITFSIIHNNGTTCHSIPSTQFLHFVLYAIEARAIFCTRDATHVATCQLSQTIVAVRYEFS